jgi:cation diffusion facilitator CzcD-associated flavoprotein CzcO
LKNWRDAPAAEQSCIARAWLAEFSETLRHRDYARTALMIHPDGYWRDLLTFGWIFKTLHGIEDVEAWLTETLDANRAHSFCLEGEPLIGAFGDYSVTLQFFFKFQTGTALGRGFVRLVESPNAPNGLKAFTVLTAMSALKAFPEATGRKRPRADLRSTSNELENWLDRRNSAREFTRKDPDVIIIGGGQSGLMLAARLGQLNVSTLVVEKTDRVGDIWRNRYRSLTLHNEICMNHFAYMPFPDTWPVYIPKDKLANWLEFYAESMEVNVWTKTTFMGAEYENSAKRWNAQLRIADGSIRNMRPSHIVLAIGVSGLPNVPTLEGQDAFGGPIVHSSGRIDDLNVKAKSVLVVGAGTSGHDIAQDLHTRGANVTMLQRSSITVVSLEPSSVRPYELYRQNDGVRPIADTDLMAASVPYDLLARLHKPLSRQMAEEDRDLLDGLRRVGFLLDNGEDDTGYFLKLLRHQAGYYLNVGASDLIIAGKIGLKAGIDIDRLEKNEIIFSDGTSLASDIIVLATGYKPLQEGVRTMFGDEVAERVGPIWGIGDDGELCNMYARTAQEGLYIAGGGIPGARAYSQYTAFLIKAAVEGLLPYSSRHRNQKSLLKESLNLCGANAQKRLPERTSEI